ncbi:MAG: GH116 family glycosyl hydrolase [Eubacteriales bacterium]|nr:GH116 family glycosyl hydrolase [Eubacteriales bacterium]
MNMKKNNWKRERTIQDNTKVYTNKDLAFRALLGGIGTGNISLDAGGRLCDFEVMNHPDKGLKIPYTFFALWAKFGQEEPRALVLEAKHEGVSSRALGHPTGELLGLPRFDESVVKTNYPFYSLEFRKRNLPLEVRLEAVSPFIPLDEVNSGIPAFRMKYTVANKGDKKAAVSVSGTMYNFAGMSHYNGYDQLIQNGQPYNKKFEEWGVSGIYMSTKGQEENDVTYGSLAIATANKNVTSKPLWQFGSWWDGAEEFWQDFREDGRLKEDTASDAVGSNIKGTESNRYVGSVAAMEEIGPGEEKEFVFYISWDFPNRYGWWPDGHHMLEDGSDKKIWHNYYSTLWKNAAETIGYFRENEAMLMEKSRLFADALYSTTLPADVIESLVSAITVIRSNTCFRIEDGRFFGWEGCFEHAGSCPGTCTHVWNYAQALAFLFPKLERSARYTEFLQETDETGNMAFRAKRLLDGEKWDMLPAADGQLGCIMRVYREWKLSGDDKFLQDVWDKVVQAMDYSLRTWDPDGDFVMEELQHNTYDIEFYGLNSLTNSILYGALWACKEMAEYLGDTKRAAFYGEGVLRGSEKMDKELWNGSYYEQKISDEDLNKYRYQYGKGCLSDQLLGQELAHLYGLGYILPKEHVAKSVKAVYDYNFKESLEGHESVQRTYAFEDEGGLLLCSWPLGGRPKQPFVYSDEVWTGIEYQVAVHLIYEGFTQEALEMINVLRKRYDGTRRSPYNEIECGNHYTRSMAAWGLLVSLSGYEFDLTQNKVSFSPRINQEDFTCFYSNGTSWGVYQQKFNDKGTMEKELISLWGSENQLV